MTAPSHSPRPPRDDAHRGDTVLDWARATGEAERLIAGLEQLVRRRRRRRHAWLAGGTAVVLLGTALWRPWQGEATARTTAAAIPTVVVAQPSVRTLADGSVVEWTGPARWEVAFTAAQRRVVLRGGKAHFQVAKEASRPFVVAAGAAEVRAVGTGFAVDLGAAAVEVVVTEGSVTVSSPLPGGAPATLAVGRQAIVRPDAPPEVAVLTAGEMRRRLAWRVPRLEFAGTPLAEVVERCNEQARRTGGAVLVLAEPGLGALRISGVLRADDVDSLLRLLEGEFGIVAERASGETRLRRR
jgi:transmembrane sensor